MLWFVRGLVMLMVGLAPAMGVAQDQQAEAAATPVAATSSPLASTVNPYGLEANGLIPPTFEGPWRFRIAVNGWLPNRIKICADAGSSHDCAALDLGFVLSYRLKYIFPVDFEARKGAFGAYLHTMFFRLEGNTKAAGGRLELDWDDSGWLIDVGASYELGRWSLGEGPRAPEVTLEPFVGARLTKQPLDITLRGRTIDDDFSNNVPVIGLRNTWDLTEHWNLKFEGDYGGFGVDDNEQTWQAVGLLGYRWAGWGLHWNFQAGYRAMRLFKLDKPEATFTEDLRGPNIILSAEF